MNIVINSIVQDLSRLVTKATGYKGSEILSSLYDATTEPARRLAAAALINAKEYVHQIVQEAGDAKTILNSLLFQRTPLHSAVLNGDFDLARYLITKGADLKTLNEQGHNVIEAYIYAGLPMYRGGGTTKTPAPDDHLQSLGYDFVTTVNAQGQNLLDIAVDHHLATKVNHNNLRELLAMGVDSTSAIKTVRAKVASLMTRRAEKPNYAKHCNKAIEQWQAILRCLGVETSPA